MMNISDKIDIDINITIIHRIVMITWLVWIHFWNLFSFLLRSFISFLGEIYLSIIIFSQGSHRQVLLDQYCGLFGF